MPNKNYIKGRAFEYKVKRICEGQGWAVTRTAGSHGAYDLVVVSQNHVNFIQYKTPSPTRADIEALRRFFMKHPVLHRNEIFNVAIVSPGYVHMLVDNGKMTIVRLIPWERWQR